MKGCAVDRDEILRIARDIGFEEISQDEWAGYSNTLEAFANAIAAHEREMCAKLFENVASDFPDHYLEQCAITIRARWNK
jgi:cyclopropane fatty-acyl-phospholipid synthase-like methyltransferase